MARNIGRWLESMSRRLARMEQRRQCVEDFTDEELWRIAAGGRTDIPYRDVTDDQLRAVLAGGRPFDQVFPRPNGGT